MNWGSESNGEILGFIRRKRASDEPKVLRGGRLMSIALGILASSLLIVGLLLYAVGWVGLWIDAFRLSILWGYWCS